MSSGIIEKLQKMSIKLFQQTIKSYSPKDALVHQRASRNNLMEILSRYPGYGIGFKVRRKTWPPGMFYIIKDAKYKAIRFGRLYGVLHKNNNSVDQYPKKMTGCNKRGAWQYEIGQFQKVTLDNGLVYTKADIEIYYKYQTRQINAKSNQSSQVSQVSNTEQQTPKVQEKQVKNNEPQVQKIKQKKK